MALVMKRALEKPIVYRDRQDVSAPTNRVPPASTNVHGINAPTADQKRTAFPQLNLAAVATITCNGPNQGLFS
jgi:hypothetical protein